MSEIIHILLVTVELGPYSEKQVRESLAAGHLLPTDLARPMWKENWMPLSEVLRSLPLPIVFAEPLARTPAQPDSLPAAIVLIAPILEVPPKTINVVPPLPGGAPQPKTLSSAVVLSPSKIPDPPSKPMPPMVPASGAVPPPLPVQRLDAPAVKVSPPLPDSMTGLRPSPDGPVRALQKKILLVTKPAGNHSPPPVDPAASSPILATDHPAAKPEKVRAIRPDTRPPVFAQAPTSPPPTAAASTSSAQLPIPKEREITPPPEAVVPYNQPRPIRPTFIGAHWQLWGRYAAIVVVVIVVWMSLNWAMVGPTLLHYWYEFNFYFFQLIDDVTSRFKPPA